MSWCCISGGPVSCRTSPFNEFNICSERTDSSIVGYLVWPDARGTDASHYGTSFRTGSFCDRLVFTVTGTFTAEPFNRPFAAHNTQTSDSERTIRHWDIVYILYHNMSKCWVRETKSCKPSKPCNTSVMGPRKHQFAQALACVCIQHDKILLQPHTVKR